MHFFWLALVSSINLVFALPNPSVPPPPNLNVDDPSSGDPEFPPRSILSPNRASKPAEFINQPDICDSQAPSDDCFRAMGSGGYLFYAKDSECDQDQKDKLATAVWDASTLAMFSHDFPNVDGARGAAAGKYYMGPDYPEFQDRISGNLKRAWEFKTSSTTDKTYITTSCKDTKKYCAKKIDGLAVGGYGWTYNGWFGYYHYITLCPPFFTLNNLSEKLQEILEDLGKGITTKPTDMRYLRTTGQYFLHEMMHTRLVYKDQPAIIDEYVRPVKGSEGHGLKAYGPSLVHRLADKPKSQSGGAERASTNADSYAMLANCLWWWDITGYFPAAVKPSRKAQVNSIEEGPLFLHVDLGKNTDLMTANIDGLFEAELNSYGYEDSSPADPNPINGNGGGQQIALASYISPLEHPELWDRMIADPKVSVLIMNVLNGPDSVYKSEWDQVIQKAKAAKKKILGYVRTGYLGLSPADPGPFEAFETRDGSHKISDWVAQVQRDTDLWYSLYGENSIEGIFFDESHNECGPNNQYAELYRFISENAKRKHPGAMTVINPGTSVPKCYEYSADTIMTFENNYTSYVTGNYPAIDWVPKDPRKIWHIIYDVPEDKVTEVAALAQKNHAGLVHITDAKYPNPYGTLPSESYMKALNSAVNGGVPLITNYTQRPETGPQIFQPTLRDTGHDYVSISLEWTYSSSDNPYAFSISSHGQETVRVPGYLREVTIGGYEPGTNGLEFSIRAVGIDGSLSGPSNPVPMITDRLDGPAIQNLKVYPSATETIYEGDIYIPSGFVRLYFSDSDVHAKNWPGWPVDFNGGYVVSHYLVEGRTLFRYSGPEKPDAHGNRMWSWTEVAKRDNVKVVRKKYHYKWTVPMGTSNINFDPEFVVVQLDGYTLRKNHFQPCPSKWKSGGGTCFGKPDYDCQGSKPMCSIGTQVLGKCNDVASSMDRGRDYISSTTNATMSGSCQSNGLEGCRVFVQGNSDDGEPCKFTGDEVWAAYQAIRTHGNCQKCGTRHFPNRCMVSVDYTPDCVTFGSSATGD